MYIFNSIFSSCIFNMFVNLKSSVHFHRKSVYQSKYAWSCSNYVLLHFWRFSILMTFRRLFPLVLEKYRIQKSQWKKEPYEKRCLYFSEFSMKYHTTSGRPSSRFSRWIINEDGDGNVHCSDRSESIHFLDLPGIRRNLPQVVERYWARFFSFALASSAIVCSNISYDVHRPIIQAASQ